MPPTEEDILAEWKLKVMFYKGMTWGVIWTVALAYLLTKVVL